MECYEGPGGRAELCAYREAEEVLWVWDLGGEAVLSLRHCGLLAICVPGDLRAESADRSGQELAEEELGSREGE